LYQQEFADLAGCSRITIQKIEQKNGSLRLSQKLARRIAHETGVAIGWLLDANPKTRPTTQDGQPYSLETFRQTRAARAKNTVDVTSKCAVHSMTLIYYAGIRALLHSALRRGDLNLVAWRLTDVLNPLLEEFDCKRPGIDPTSRNTFFSSLWPSIRDDLGSVIYGVPGDKLPELAKLLEKAGEKKANDYIRRRMNEPGLKSLPAKTDSRAKAPPRKSPTRRRQRR
jgi:transcriptional regulator with XRE-family HTH domain